MHWKVTQKEKKAIVYASPLQKNVQAYDSYI